MSIYLYDKTNIEKAFFNNTYEHQYAKNYIVPMIQNGVKNYIDNAHTCMMLLSIDDLRLPVTMNDEEFENTYVVSPFTQYISYAIEELKELQAPALEKVLKYLLNGLGKVLKMMKFNKVIIVNNWLLSTNLYVPITKEQIERITNFLKNKYPHHTILFRSINDFAYKELMHHFKDMEYTFIGSRQVYFFDGDNENFIKSRARSILKKDHKLFEQTGYTVMEDEITDEDIHRLVELYNDLYIKKYSKYNPQFNEKFFKLCLDKELLKIKCLKKENKIDAVLGYFIRENIMTAPIFGYDTVLPKKLGLYRMLSYILVDDARKKDLLLHESAGAAAFKRCRGAVTDIEYTAVYMKHLPLYRKVPWFILKGLINHIGVFLLKKYKL